MGGDGFWGLPDHQGKSGPFSPSGSEFGMMLAADFRWAFILDLFTAEIQFVCRCGQATKLPVGPCPIPIIFYFIFFHFWHPKGVADWIWRDFM